MVRDNISDKRCPANKLHQQLIDLAEKLYGQEDMLLLQKILSIRKKVYLSTPSEVSREDLGFQMAIVLLENKADATAVSSAILYFFYVNNFLGSTVIEEIDSSVILVIKGVEQMSLMRNFQNTKTNDEQTENYRKMLLSIIKDVRIVLVKLSEKICIIRSCVDKKLQDDFSKNTAVEIIDIYAPLANRLGLTEIKRELEDKSLYLLEPDQYQDIQKKLNLHRNERIVELESFIKKLQIVLRNNDINASVTWRIKNIYSIWRKMQKKSYGVHQLYDISAIRVLVESVSQCYKVLSFLQNDWDTLSSEYSDYISNPKPNGYQSIHTIVLGVNQSAIEVQIRTFKMHDESENGIAAHWRYKEGVKQDKSYEARILWLKVLLGLQNNYDDQSLLFNEKVLDSRVYVFTPNGDVIDMPSGSTVLDFAYNIHTMVGHRCKGAKLNGRIVTLKHIVSTGDKVEIITGNMPSPSKDWMNAKAGYIKSSKIRARIARWFKSQDKDENAKLGKEKLLIQYPDLDLKKVDFIEVAEHFNLKNQDSLFSAICLGDIKLNQVINHLKHYSKESKKVASLDESRLLDEDKFKKKSIVIVHGVDGLFSSIARCCKPILGDNISGYVTRDKGVSIHRANCINFLRMKKQVPERVLEVQWGKENTTKFIVDIAVNFFLGGNTLKNISSLLSSQNVDLISIKEQVDGDDGFAFLRIAVLDLDNVVFLLSKIKSIADVKQAYRI